MIVQCEACQTRFKLADDKVKAGGTKVRCSKCKEVFTVLPAVPEVEEESVDFGSFNMERLSEDTADDTSHGASDDSTQTDEAFTAVKDSAEFDGQPDEVEVDFSAFEKELGDAGPGEELADDFSFADSTQPALAPEEPSEEKTANFAAAFDESGEPSGPVEFSFDAESSSERVEVGRDDFSADDREAFEPGAFSFDDKAETGGGPADDFAFGDPEESDSFSFGEGADTSQTSDDATGAATFSMEDDNPFGEDSAGEWQEESSGSSASFDFDEPSFETSAEPTQKADDGGLQFGEIDFADDGGKPSKSDFAAEDDFSKATMQPKLEAELRPDVSPPRREPPPERDLDDREKLPAPPKKGKSSLSRVVVLLVLMLVALGGAAGYLYMQEGALNLNVLTRYLPFLQDYIGETAPGEPIHKIGINISGSSYVNGKAGQLLVIQGTAVNNHRKTRSAITIKGILLDASGQTLLQQTVFCGNYLSESDLKSLPFTAIEEAMNNQFGDSLSNMNVASGASIPFTIVFRNLPSGIANINVEVVESKPGAR